MKYSPLGGGQEWIDPRFYYPDGFLSITNNGGRNWEKKYFPHSEFLRINDIDFANDSMGLGVGHTPAGCVVKINF